MKKRIQNIVIIISAVAGMIFGALYEDLSDKETNSYIFVDNSHIFNTILKKDTIVKKKVIMRWRTRKVCCSDSICCGHRH